MFVDFYRVSVHIFSCVKQILTPITTEHWLFFSDNILPADVQQGGGREARWTLFTLSQALLRLCALVCFSLMNLQSIVRFEGVSTNVTL